MKKSILLTLCYSFIFTFQSLAQDPKVVWGTATDKTDKMQPIKVAGKDETGVYILLKESPYSGRRTLAKYDLNMNYQWTSVLEVNISKRAAQYVDLIFFQNKTILFISDYDKDSKSKKIYATTISKTGVIDPNCTEVQTFKNVNSYNDVIVTVTLNKKESLIKVTSSLTNELKNTLTQIVTMNENFLIQSKKEYELPGIEGDVVWRVNTLDANYNYYCSYSIKAQKSKDKNSEKKTFFITFDQKTKEKKQYELAIDNYQIENHFVLFDTLTKRYVSIFGYYGDKKDFALAGTFVIKFDLLNKKIDSVLVKPFDSGLVNAVSSIKTIEEKPNASDNLLATFKEYKIKNVCVNENGNMIVVSEQRRETYSGGPSTSGSSSSGYSSSVTYHFGNILITTFDIRGNAIWSNVVPKYQVTSQYETGSISSFMYEDELYIMYLDNPKNGLTISSNQYIIPDTYDKLALVSVKVNMYGNKIEKSIVQSPSMDKKGIWINVSSLTKIDNELFLTGKQEDNYKVGKMILK